MDLGEGEGEGEEKERESCFLLDVSLTPASLSCTVLKKVFYSQLSTVPAAQARAVATEKDKKGGRWGQNHCGIVEAGQRRVPQSCA